MPNGAQNLGTQLGSLLFGNKAGSDQAYFQGQVLGAQASDRMASARKARAEALIDEDRLGARQGINVDALTTAGYAPDQAALLGDILRSNSNVDLRNLGTLQSPTAGQAQVDARDAFKGGNEGLGNLMLALSQGKPLETTKIDNGQAFNPYGDAGQQVNLTALGDATVGDKRASAAQHYAGATSDMAHARLYDKQTAVGGFNPNTGGNGPAAVVAPAAVNPNAPTGEAFLRTIAPGDAATVKALSEGRLAFPTGTALKSPYWQGILQQVAQYDPSFDTTNAPARANTLKSFKGAGPNAQQINALQTFAEHVNLLGQNFDKLHNTPVPYLNSVINSVGSGLGLKNSVGAYNQNALNSAMELESLWKKGAGSEADIARSMANLSSASSPEQFKQAQQTLVKLAHGKLSAMRDQYIAGMGATHNPMQFLDPKTQEIFSTIDPEGSATYANEAQAPSGADIAAGTVAPVATTSGAYHVGQIIMHGGKPYRVTGGDPNDPDVEPVQ